MEKLCLGVGIPVYLETTASDIGVWNEAVMDGMCEYFHRTEYKEEQVGREPNIRK